MIENLTVAVTCRCMVYDSDLENFLHNKSFPKIKLSINDDSSVFQFTENMETVELKLTTKIIQSENTLSISYEDVDQIKFYAGVRILAVKFYGCNLGMQIFQSQYKDWIDQKVYPHQCYMSQPGEWLFDFKSPVAQNFYGIIHG